MKSVMAMWGLRAFGVPALAGVTLSGGAVGWPRAPENDSLSPVEAECRGAAAFEPWARQP